MACTTGAYCEFAAELRCAIDSDRAKGILDLVRTLLVTRENVVCRHLNEWNASLGAGSCERSGGERVDRPSGDDIAFGLVYRSVGCTIDNHGPRTLCDFGGDRGSVGEVEVNRADRNHTPSIGPLAALELGTELPARTCDENLTHLRSGRQPTALGRFGRHQRPPPIFVSQI